MRRREFIVGAVAVAGSSVILSGLVAAKTKDLWPSNVRVHEGVDNDAALRVAIDAVMEINERGFVRGRSAEHYLCDYKVMLREPTFEITALESCWNTWTGDDPKWGPYESGVAIKIRDGDYVVGTKVVDRLPTAAYVDASNESLYQKEIIESIAKTATPRYFVKSVIVNDDQLIDKNRFVPDFEELMAILKKSKSEQDLAIAWTKKT